jgi:hypothetical protein
VRHAGFIQEDSLLEGGGDEHLKFDVVFNDLKIDE